MFSPDQHWKNEMRLLLDCLLCTVFYSLLCTASRMQEECLGLYSVVLNWTIVLNFIVQFPTVSMLCFITYFHGTVPYISFVLDHALIQCPWSYQSKVYGKRERFHMSSVQPQIFPFRVRLSFFLCLVLDFLSIHAARAPAYVFFVPVFVIFGSWLTSRDVQVWTTLIFFKSFLHCTIDFSLAIFLAFCLLSEYVFLLIYVFFFFLGFFWHPVI